MTVNLSVQLKYSSKKIFFSSYCAVNTAFCKDVLIEQAAETDVSSTRETAATKMLKLASPIFGNGSI